MTQLSEYIVFDKTIPKQIVINWSVLSAMAGKFEADERAGETKRKRAKREFLLPIK